MSVTQVTCDTPEEVASHLHDVDILYTFDAIFPLAVADCLKWVQLSSTGVNYLLRQPIMESDIVVTTTRGIHATPIAEYVFGALLQALESGHLAGAVLDTFHEEPLPADSRFWDLPRVVVTPHVAPNSSYYNDRASDVFAENMRRYLAGESMFNVFDHERG